MALTRYIMGTLGAHNNVITGANTGSAFVVATGGTGVLSNAESNPIGSLSAVCTATVTSGGQYIAKNGLTASAICGDLLFKIKTNFSGALQVFWLGASSQRWSIEVNANRTLTIRNDAFAGVYTTTYAPAVDTWMWLRWYVVKSATVGKWHITLATAAAPATLVENSTEQINQNCGPDDYTELRIGAKCATGTQTGAIVVGSWAYDPAATGLPPIYMLDPPTLVVDQPANNVIDVRDSTDGDGTSITYLDPVEVTSTGTTPIELTPGVWLFDTTDDSTWTVGVTQGDLQEDTENVDIVATGAAGTRNPKMPSGTHPGTTWA